MDDIRVSVFVNCYACGRVRNEYIDDTLFYARSFNGRPDLACYINQTILRGCSNHKFFNHFIPLLLYMCDFLFSGLSLVREDVFVDKCGQADANYRIKDAHGNIVYCVAGVFADLKRDDQIDYAAYNN